MKELESGQETITIFFSTPENLKYTLFPDAYYQWFSYNFKFQPWGADHRSVRLAALSRESSSEFRCAEKPGPAAPQRKAAQRPFRKNHEIWEIRSQLTWGFKGCRWRGSDW